MSEAPIPTFEDNVANREKAKAYEKKTKLHKLQINKNTIVYCKNEYRLEDYKKYLNRIYGRT